MKTIIMNQYGQIIDENTKTKWSHPYDYDPIIQYQTNVEPETGVYSDRMFQQNSEKFNTLARKHFGDEGQHFDNRDPLVIEQFVSEFVGRKIKLTTITEYCNVSSGFPLWRFDYCYVPEET